MSEILQNTGVTLWSIRDDYDELQTSVFEALTGTGGKSNIRLIDEAIGNINSKLNGYYFEYSDNRLYICKKSEDENIKRYPVTLNDNNGHIASKVDGSTITIDENGIVRGLPVDDALSSISTNPIQNKVVKAKFDEVDGKINANETTISSHTTALATLNGEGEGSVKKTVTDEIAKVVADAPESLDTLKEISDWISSHESDASAMNSAIQTNKSDIATLQTDKVDKETGKSLLADTDKTNYDDAVSKSHSHDNKSVLDEITSDKVTAWNNKSDFSGNYNDLSDKPTIPKGDGITITMDEDGTLHGVAKVTVDTSLSPTSTNPVQNKVVNAAIEKKADTILYDKSANTLYLKSGSTVLSSAEIKSGGGGATITPKPTVNPQIKNDDKKVIITWEDPTDTVIEGSTFSKWAGTKLVMKESGYPTSPDDGTVLVDNTTRDKYKTTGFEKSGLTNDKQYYFALFPYSTDGVYNYDSGNRLLGEPTELKIVTFADGTDEEIAKMIQAHYNDKINIADYWAVGDMRTVHLSAMAATGVSESHRAQDVQFVIGDFNHDDLETPINGHTKAAITLLQKDCLMDATSASNVNNGSADTEKGYMNSSNTNVGGWKDCARRKWCNNVYFKALPTIWQSMVKTVNKKVSVGNGQSTIETVQDKIFLAAEIEIFGSTTYSVSGEGTQYQYYKNATANRYKMPKWNHSSVSQLYWERSPRSGYATSFCNVDYNGEAFDREKASEKWGIAPNFCI